MQWNYNPLHHTDDVDSELYPVFLEVMHEKVQRAVGVTDRERCAGARSTTGLLPARFGRSAPESTVPFSSLLY